MGLFPWKATQPKKVLRRVIITDHTAEPQSPYKRVIDVPEGGTVRAGFAEHPTVFDKDGNILWSIRVGYDCEIEFIYEEVRNE